MHRPQSQSLQMQKYFLLVDDEVPSTLYIPYSFAFFTSNTFVNQACKHE